MVLRFWFDLACPWAFLAARQLGPLAARVGAEIAWEPVLLGGIFRALGLPDRPGGAPPRRAMAAADLRRSWALSGMPPMRADPEAPRRTVDALRLLHRAPPAARGPLAMDLFAALWLHGEDVSAPALLDRLAAAHGLPRADGEADAAARAALREATAAAVAAGVFGVPTARAEPPGGPPGPLCFGADRLHLLEGALRGHPVDPEPPPPPAGLPPLDAGPLVVYHDVASPFSYLGVARVGELARRRGVPLIFKPILLGALFRQIGTPEVPLFAMSAPRQAWMGADLFAQAARWGVPFQFPACFPVRSVLPQRVCLAAPEATLPLYRALWADGRDIGQPEVVAEVLTAAGLDAPALLGAAASAPVKAALHANTAEAESIGVCGVPSFHVRGRHLLWGQDRLHQVERLLVAPLPGEEEPA